MKKLLSLDIEDLMTISVASKRVEKVENAPGVISVITARDIENYGATDLRDLLIRLPNTYTYGTDLFRDSVTSIRGQALSSDSHVLILLDGRPMRESLNTTISAPVYRNIPLEIIEKIEVIRGPGSVLYGSGAYAGAINIVTKKPSEKPKGSVTAGYGSFNTPFASGAFSQKIEDADVMVAGKSLDSDGWPYRKTDEAGIDNTRDFSRSNYGYFARGSYKGLTLTGFSGRDNDLIFAGIPSGWRTSNFTSDWKRDFFDAQFDRDLAADWKGKLNFTYNGTNGDIQGRRRSFDEFLFEPSVNGLLFDKINAVAGFTYQKIQGKLITENVSYANDRFGTYAQGDYSPLDFLKLIAGFQINKPQGVDYDFSPRVGAIANFNPNSGVKLLYGEAFRSAAATEQTTTSASIGDPHLRPEKSSTFDAQLFYVNPKYYAALTYYRTRQADTIKVIADPIGLKLVNSGSIDYQGIELEGKAAVAQNLDLTGSISRQYNEDDTGNTDIGRVPKLMIKSGIAYNWEKGYSLGLFNSYFSASGRMPGSRPVNPSADSYSFLTANASMKIRKVTGLDGLPDLTLKLYGENLLQNDAVYFPEVARGVINTVPMRSGRAFFGSVTLGF